MAVGVADRPAETSETRNRQFVVVGPITTTRIHRGLNINYDPHFHLSPRKSKAVTAILPAR